MGLVVKYGDRVTIAAAIYFWSAVQVYLTLVQCRLWRQLL